MKLILDNGPEIIDIIALAQKMAFDPAKVRPDPIDPRGFQKVADQFQDHPAFMTKSRFK